MKVYDATSIRNVAVVGHGSCGKTQLVSAMLYTAGMVNRLGRVDDGTTVTDYDPEEIARKHTLSTSLAFAEWRKTKINLLDTPGVANFFADARARRRGPRPTSWGCRDWSPSAASTAIGPRSNAPSSRCAAPATAASCRFSCRSARARRAAASSTSSA